MTDPWGSAEGEPFGDAAPYGEDGPYGGRSSSGGASAPRPGGRAADRAARAAGHGRGARAAGGRARARTSSRRAKPLTRGRRLLRVAGYSTAGVVLVAAAGGGWLYHHWSGNLSTFGISGGGQEKANANGQTPINILVIGTDARTSAEDCKLGGDCSSGGNGNADVEMLVHISADRSNASIVSIPRDTVTKIPACQDAKDHTSEAGYTGMINSALAYGPDCQIAAVRQMTGLPIDHFMEVDFSGVVNMSDAVGGVDVCVDNNVYDTYSHLKLSKGDHTLKGVAALEFVRSRHGFGNGGDVGRAGVQHIFLSSLMRKMESAGTLTNPGAMLGIANAATKALTVDSGLGSVGKLISLAKDVSSVPSSRMTFTTMQTEPDPTNPNRLVEAPSARSLFAAIANDQSLSGSSKKSSSSGSSKKSSGSSGSSGSSSGSAGASATASAVPAAQIAVQVQNGSGITGKAGQVVNALVQGGLSSQSTAANAPGAASTTTLTYGPGQQAEAETAAKVIGLPTSHLQQGGSSGLVLVIGSDWPSDSDTFSSAARPAPASTADALDGASAEKASTSGVCAQVSTQDTVEVGGVPMTPTQAYADSPKVPDSAP